MPFLSILAESVWRTGKQLDRLLPKRDLPTPFWSSRPLLKKTDRYLPPLGPRQVDSVCPRCQLETRDGIIRNKQRVSDLTDANRLISGTITEEAGRVVMRSTCERHGLIEDLLATDASFFWRMEKLFPGCDFSRPETGSHGAHDVLHGRGSFLIVDLTTRCNMKCDPCFMNANEIGHVHELTLEQIKKQLDYAITVEPRREINILFSGGEPTLSPHFLEAVTYARGLGMVRLHVATNGLKFAEEANFAVAARGAGLHGVYLQLDGVSDEANMHRGVANLFEVKRCALDNIFASGMHTTLQVTVVRGLNNSNIGSIVTFAAQHSKKVHGIVFQPIMFTGRDEQVSDERRYQQRYTLSQLAHDLTAQLGNEWQPLRDWFPMGVYGPLCTYLDMLNPGRNIGSTYVNAHPDSAVFSPLLVNRRTGEWKPLSSFFNLESFLEDVDLILDRAHIAVLSKSQLLVSLARNFNQNSAPAGFKFRNLLAIASQSASRFNSQNEERIHPQEEWALLIITGMWFQDLYNYELTNIQTSTALVADLGFDEDADPTEISFSFKNAAGWRQVVENLSSLPSLSEWHRTRGRHPIYANGIAVTVNELTESLEQLTPQVTRSVDEYV